MTGDATAIRLTPYASAMGVKVERVEDDMPVLALDFGPLVQGRPGALHGGAISGLLETAAYAGLAQHLRGVEHDKRLKPINVTVQYLSAGKERTTYAKARIVRLGRRNANVAVEAWQDDPASPIASAVMNILMVDPAG